MLYEVITKHFRTSEIVVPFQPFTTTFQLLNDYEFSTNREFLTFGAEFKTEYFLLRYFVITSYSIHYTKLYEPSAATCRAWIWMDIGRTLNVTD